MLKFARRHFSSPHFKNTRASSNVQLEKDLPINSEFHTGINKPVWSDDELNIKKTHVAPQDAVDWLAMGGVKMLRFVFDWGSGYRFGGLTDRKLIRRILFLETAAGIPGMVAGSLRHLRSLRRVQRDGGWIRTLTEEAENERMHMLTFMDLYQPGYIFRAAVLVTQGIFWNTFFIAYLASPRMCHRFVGYLEEEAVRTYTAALQEIDAAAPGSNLKKFAERDAPAFAKHYWQLNDDATMLDVILQIRADEAHHRDVNHAFAELKTDDPNPEIFKEADARSSKSQGSGNTSAAV